MTSQPRPTAKQRDAFSDQKLLFLMHCLLPISGLTMTFLLPARVANCSTVEANTPELADVKAAILSAHENDTVKVPPGTASWTSTLIITKGITLQGATGIEGSLDNPAVTDKTIILDEVPRKGERHQASKAESGLAQSPRAGLPRARQGDRAGAAANPRRDAAQSLSRLRGAAAKSKVAAGPKTGHPPAIMVARLEPDQSFRLTGFTFRYGSVASYADNGGVHLEGTCPSARIDHCHFDQLYANPFIMTHGQIYGVVDHCVLDERPRAQPFQVFHDGWGGHAHGDGSWADAPYFGSEKFLFIEDNTFRNATGYTGNGIDSYGGGRYVARHNYLVDTPIAGHGTETSGRFRGVRAIEVYNNTCVWNRGAGSQLRSGTMLEFNNVLTGKKKFDFIAHLACYREARAFPSWGAANGNNRLDSNDAHGLYARGDHTAENKSATLVVADAGWKVNQWIGYSVTNTTQTFTSRTGAAFHLSSCITGNNSDTIKIRPNGLGQDVTFNNGDGYEIYRVVAALDQPGRGKGDLLADKDPVVTGSWPHQALEPIYAWANTYNNSRQLDVTSHYPTIQENREFYNQKTPFDGTAGVGVGKLSNRPKTCTPGVAYWATDEGEWDSTHDGPDGQLYVCTALKPGRCITNLTVIHIPG